MLVCQAARGRRLVGRLQRGAACPKRRRGSVTAHSPRRLGRRLSRLPPQPASQGEHPAPSTAREAVALRLCCGAQVCRGLSRGIHPPPPRHTKVALLHLWTIVKNASGYNACVGTVFNCPGAYDGTKAYTTGDVVEVKVCMCACAHIALTVFTFTFTYVLVCARACACACAD